MKLRPVRIDEKPVMKMPSAAVHDVRVRRRRAVRRVERPAGVDAAADRRDERERAAEDVDVPAQEVDAREREVLRADHDRDEEVAEHGRDRRDQEEEDHHHAVHGEHLVVGLGVQQVARRREQLEADHQREETAEREERRDRDQVEQRDPLVVLGQQPGFQPVAVVQVVQGFHKVLASECIGLPAAPGPCRPRRGACWLSD